MYTSMLNKSLNDMRLESVSSSFFKNVFVQERLDNTAAPFPQMHYEVPNLTSGKLFVSKWLL